jgi:hypothetical protein
MKPILDIYGFVDYKCRITFLVRAIYWFEARKAEKGGPWGSIGDG